MAALSAKASKIEASQSPFNKDTTALASKMKTVEASLTNLAKARFSDRNDTSESALEKQNKALAPLERH